MPDVQTLYDREMIKELTYRYCNAIDSADVESFLEVWTDDAEMYARKHDFDPHIDVEGIDAIAELIESNAEHTRRELVEKVHVPLNPILDVDGDEATGYWYYNSMDVYTDRRSDFGLGRYEIEYRRVDGEWKISSLRAQRKHTLAIPADVAAGPEGGD
jgi:ketosteroid isomerase-like protein